MFSANERAYRDSGGWNVAHVSVECFTSIISVVHRDVICHRESVHTSKHLEETTKDSVPQRSIVKISEQEYLLQDVTTEPVTFVVEQLVPDGWQVDSDPRPTEMIGPTAAFHVIAQPGQTVRLHVGLRHTNPIRESD